MFLSRELFKVKFKKSFDTKILFLLRKIKNENKNKNQYCFHNSSVLVTVPNLKKKKKKESPTLKALNRIFPVKEKEQKGPTVC